MRHCEMVKWSNQWKHQLNDRHSSTFCGCGVCYELPGMIVEIIYDHIQAQKDIIIQNELWHSVHKELPQKYV